MRPSKMSVPVMQRLLPLILLIAVCLLPAQVHAQGSIDCEFDVSEVSTLLSKAQVKATSGDMPGALDLLDQAEQSLKELQDRCSISVMDITLSEKFSDAKSPFTMNYPKGWTAQPIEESSSSGGDTKPILFANEPDAYKVIAESEPHPTAKAVIAYVGNARQVVTQLGGLKDIDYDNMNAEKLLKAVVTGATSSNATFGTPEKTKPIGDYETAEASFLFHKSDKKTVVAEGSVLIMRLTSDQYVVLVSFAPEGQQKSIAALTRAMAATLRYKS